MAMFNEVFIPCKCGAKACAQIRQIVLGFGEFELNKPESYSNLSSEEKEELFSQVDEASFECESCGNYGKASRSISSSFILDQQCT